MKYVDTLGRVEKFQAKQKAARVVRKKEKVKKKREQPKTLKEMLKGK